MERGIAYFSMEIGLRPEIPTYSGGLGILAGDTIKSAADLKIPLHAVTLLSEQGYFHQTFDAQHNQQETPVYWPKHDYLELLPERVYVHIEGRIVHIQAWRYIVKGLQGHQVPVYYLDTNLPENSAYDRTLTSRLYGGDYWYRMCQEIVLGIGGVRLLRTLQMPIKKYHMNEGHAAFLTLELLREQKRVADTDDATLVEQVKNMCVFTTHTPVPAGHDAFEEAWVKRALGNQFDIDMAQAVRDGKFNMTILAMNFASHINGVAKKHGEVSSSMFPGYTIYAITNGVHAPTWVSEPFTHLFNKYIEGWKEDNFMLRYALNIPNNEVWQAHQQAKQQLIEYVNTTYNTSLDVNVLTIGFARRFASYKRADLIFQDMQQLLDMHKHVGKIQVIMAGKAHPHDTGGKEKLRYIRELMDTYKDRITLVFLDNYEMWLAHKMISGCDIWLNTPIRPREASGTSGMKATLNGVLHFSILDGWWIEGWVEQVTGWSIGPNADAHTEDDAQDLYDKLRTKIIPLYYNDKQQWITMMKHAISHNGSFFNTQRMVSQYMLNSWL
ncbi:MAG: alpha-glucan family phosphorylase [Candidatus Woesearchaeota archaeon]